MISRIFLLLGLPLVFLRLQKQIVLFILSKMELVNQNLYLTVHISCHWTIANKDLSDYGSINISLVSWIFKFRTLSCNSFMLYLLKLSWIDKNTCVLWAKHLMKKNCSCNCVKFYFFIMVVYLIGNKATMYLCVSFKSPRLLLWTTWNLLIKENVWSLPWKTRLANYPLAVNSCLEVKKYDLIN